MKCQWCGKEFTPLKSWQRYCSPACRVAANRKRLPKDEVHTQETVLIRSFLCAQCGKVVNVYHPSDNRFKFCCVHKANNLYCFDKLLMEIVDSR